MNDPVSDLTWAALSSKETVRASYEIASSAIEAGVPGDFVECGVFAGSNAAAMARAILSSNEYGAATVCTACHATGKTSPFSDALPCSVCSGTGRVPSVVDSRRVHLFDSFTGVPAGGEHDDKWTHPEGVSACSRAQVEEYMAQWKIPPELLVYHEGLFCQTVPFFGGQFAAAGGKIAVLRLDGDLYESTKVCLEHLYPLVSVGGWVIIDDWNLAGCRKAVEEYFGVVPAPVYFHKSA